MWLKRDVKKWNWIKTHENFNHLSKDHITKPKITVLKYILRIIFQRSSGK